MTDSADPRPDAAPFDLTPSPTPGSGSRRSVLLLHGFTGTPYEMRFLGEALARRGLRAVGPLLRGHGGAASDLEPTTHRDWVAGAEEILAKLRRESDRVAVVGLSLGGLVALELARRNPDVAALVCLAVPLWLPGATALGIRALSLLTILRRLPKLGGSDIRDARVKQSFPSGSALPLAPLRSLLELQRIVRANAAGVSQPTLIMHADADHVAPPRCALELYEHLPSKDKRLVRLTESYHIITVDVERDVVAREVGDFLVERM